MSNDFKARLNKALEIRGIKPIELSETTGISKARISQYMNGVYVPKSKATYIIAKALNINETWLMGYDVPMERQEPTNIQAVISSDNIYNVPVFGSVSAGFGAYAADEILDYIPTIITNSADAENTIAIKVTGDSMYPKIEDGDTIIVRKQTSVDSGSIAVLLLDGDEGLVKKVNYGPDWIELVSINPEYKTHLFEGKEVLRLQVVGLVKQVIKML